MISKTTTPDVMSIQAQSYNPSFESIGLVRSYARKSEIVSEGDPASRVYEVVSGTVCTSRMLNEGHRQIAGFYLSGELVGLESTSKHAVGAQAITDAKVRIIEKRALNALASSDKKVADRLLSLMTRDLGRKEELLLLLHRTAQDRLIGFIIDIAGRVARKTDRIALPMFRQDIADYLGLTIETVSRTLTEFERRGAIKITRGRSIVLRSQPVNGRAQTHRLFRAFEGIKGPPPRTEQEFENWLASHEGKATVFELTSLSRLGETGHS
jgi:CRP/FNR family transcriptional regulator, nitrogen fixation regulation protein